MVRYISAKEMEDILKTLPISYYLKHKIPVKMNPDPAMAQAYFDPVNYEITLGYGIIKDITYDDATESWESVEENTRDLLYHEISHVLLTPPNLMRDADDIAELYSNPRYSSQTCSYIRSAGKTIMNIFEDERIETLLKDYYMKVNFKKFVKLVNNYKPKQYPANAMQAFYNLVRFRECMFDASLLTDVDNLIMKYKKITYEWGTNSDPKLWDHSYEMNGYIKEVFALFGKVAETFKSATPPAPSKPATPPSPSSPKSAPPSPGSGAKSSSGTKTSSDPGSKSAENEEGKPEETEEGNDTKGTKESGKESEASKKKSKGDTTENPSDESEDGESEESAKDDSNDESIDESESSGDDEREVSEEKSSQPENWEGKDEISENIDNATNPDQKAPDCEESNDHCAWMEDATIVSLSPTELQRLIDTATERFNESKYGNAKFSKKIEMAINSLSAYKKSNSGATMCYSGGRINVRATINPMSQNRWFKKDGGDIDGGTIIHLNMWCDGSGSFVSSIPEVNKMIHELRNLEKKISKFSFDLIRIENDITLFPKNARAMPEYGGGNCLPKKIYKLYDELQLHNANNYNIILFDGCAYSNSYYDKEDGHTESTSSMAKNFAVWNHSNCVIISDTGNMYPITTYCPNAKVKIIKGNYANVLIDTTAELLAGLLR